MKGESSGKAKRGPVRTRTSPREVLIETTREVDLEYVPVGPGRFEMRLPGGWSRKKSIDEQLAFLRRRAKEILDQDREPERPDLITRKTVAREMFWRIMRIDEALEQIDGKNEWVLIAIDEALRLVGAYYELGLLEEETAIDAAHKSKDAAVQGGRAKRDSYAIRNVLLAGEFLRERDRMTRLPGSQLSDSVLKARIGARHGLKRSSAIEAVDDGLQRLDKKSSGNRGKPD